jgi:glycosyltransferase involved in cell wall biosynthesis
MTPTLPKHVAILSFEGPDRYSLVGGLGTRAAALAHALAEAGHETELFFVGDPELPGAELVAPRLILRRWCQWISSYHRANAYDGERNKIRDITASLPRYIVEELVRPAAERGERVLILAEEWQMAPATIALHALLEATGLRTSVTILWNANNTYGFDEIDWPALRAAATITSVSKYMKFELAQIGVVPSLVIPNGISPALLAGAPPKETEALRNGMRGRPSLVKVGRFDPDKNWLQAVDAVAELKTMGMAPQLIVRGGREPYGERVFERAEELGLSVERVVYEGHDAVELGLALSQASADLVHLRAFLPEPTLFALYAAADAVLANSGKEPFGLVGLEVMAAGGIVVCGATGEEYAEPFVNALVTDSNDGRELAAYLYDLLEHPQRADAMREAAAQTCERYIWPVVLGVLAAKVAYVDATRG